MSRQNDSDTDEVEAQQRSALDVPDADLGISTNEIVEFIREGRKQF